MNVSYKIPSDSKLPEILSISVLFEVVDITIG